MALIPSITTPTRENDEEVRARFGIAQDAGAPTSGQLTMQRNVRDKIAELASEINSFVADSREKSLAFTALEEALMWTGKAIFRP